MKETISHSIEEKYKKGNQLLFSRQSECLLPLLSLLEAQKHKTLILWALDCAQEALTAFETRCPADPRPRKALELSRMWAYGMIKMPQAKKAILEAHAVAKELEDKECIALVHAIGQAASTVHTGSHAPGLIFYELTAVVHRAGLKNCDAPLGEKIDFYSRRLLYWQVHIDDVNIGWAKFLRD
jgi:hypothetical protein